MFIMYNISITEAYKKDTIRLSYILGGFLSFTGEVVYLESRV